MLKGLVTFDRVSAIFKRGAHCMASCLFPCTQSPSGKEFTPFKVDTFWEGRKNNLESVASQKKYIFPLKEFTLISESSKKCALQLDRRAWSHIRVTKAWTFAEKNLWKLLTLRGLICLCLFWLNIHVTPLHQKKKYKFKSFMTGINAEAYQIRCAFTKPKNGKRKYTLLHI